MEDGHLRAQQRCPSIVPELSGRYFELGMEVVFQYFTFFENFDIR